MGVIIVSLQGWLIHYPNGVTIVIQMDIIILAYILLSLFVPIRHFFMSKYLVIQFLIDIFLNIAFF